ncbi:MAG: prepilin peptidase [Candidatus Eisenbacteria bacterium]
MYSVLLVIVGLAVGSFLNVCIHRIPRKISIIRPRSRCPECGKPLEARDNIPLLSFLLLGGKCRHCGKPISFRYPAVELLAAALLVLCHLKYGLSLELVVYYAFSCAMLAVSFIDYDHRIIPDVINLAFMVIGLACSFLTSLGFLSSVLGILIGGGSLALVAFLYLRVTGVEGMGGGDVKLASMIGAFLGWKGALLVIFLASLGGALLGLVLILVFRKSRRTPIPFGTFMAPAAVFVALYGPRLIELYTSVVGEGP